MASRDQIKQVMVDRVRTEGLVGPDGNPMPAMDKTLEAITDGILQVESGGPHAQTHVTGGVDVIPDAVPNGASGLMSGQDKAKLDSMAPGAEPNQNAFGSVKVGATTIQADSEADTLEIVAGANISVTPDAANDRVTIAVIGTVPDADRVDGKHASDFALAGHTHSAGDIGAAPASHTHDDRYYTESETDALLAGKANVSHGHDPASIGAAPAGHNHDDTYYTETETNSLISGHAHSGGADGAQVNYANIVGKPTSFTPSAHKSTHASGGSDALTPGDIGAETPAGAQAKVDAHANRKDNPHQVTAAQVGAAPLSHTHAGSDVTSQVNDSDKLDGKHASDFAAANHAHTGVYAPASHEHIVYTDFYVDGDADTYYPVVIETFGSDINKTDWIELFRYYSWPAPDTWNTATHRGGLNLFIGNVLSGWGGQAYYLDITLGQSYSKMVADITVPGPDTDSIIVWLRGGHAQYRLITSNAALTATPYIGDYVNKPGTQYETTYSPKPAVEPLFDFTNDTRRFYTMPELYIGGGYRNPKYGNKVWHAGNDGSGSGLDADLLDGKHAADFANASHTHTKSQITDFPTAMAPTAHKLTHASGGTDALAPADIGAAPASHTHAGSDITSSVADADELDGYHANTGVVASTIPVRDASGKVPGSITGDADTVDGSHAGTGPNNVLKLDASGLVPLANIPATLTGKNADQLDGYHANTGTMANTIPVRDSSGKIPGSITGDADTVDGAHAGTGANNVLKLDANGLVPLGNIPGTLTGKDADTVDGLHAADIMGGGPHAATHAIDGSDPVTPESIGVPSYVGPGDTIYLESLTQRTATQSVAYTKQFRVANPGQYRVTAEVYAASLTQAVLALRATNCNVFTTTTKGSWIAVTLDMTIAVPIGGLVEVTLSVDKEVPTSTPVGTAYFRNVRLRGVNATVTKAVLKD